MLCPPRVLGYILKQKQWAQLQVDLLKTVPVLKDPKDNSAWTSRLQLADNDTKKFLLDLVSSHASNSDQRPRNALEIDDMISQKGKGLIILLYGEIESLSNFELYRLMIRDRAARCWENFDCGDDC